MDRPPKPELVLPRQRTFRELGKQFHAFMAQGRHRDALACCERALHLFPNSPDCHSDAALCCLHLERWQEAVDHCKAAFRWGPPRMETLDILSHASGGLGLDQEVRKWGSMALRMRLERFGGPPVIPHVPYPLPPAPSPVTRAQNIIAFSLFGALPKYCETAVLNAEASATVYPDWTCHFYVDETVPDHVVSRLMSAGSRVIRVDQVVSRWPGLMWRFAAYDMPGLHRAIFRDADSLISTREAKAVAEWIDSGRLFHHMRDSRSHTELLMAGLWGCVGGALPPMRRLVEAFLRDPPSSVHFADQFFLRSFVWQYARESLLQHDSTFGFLDALPFPDGPRPPDFGVGDCIANAVITLEVDAPENTRADWTLVVKGEQERTICSYTGRIVNGGLQIALPRDWALAFKAGAMDVRYRLDLTDR